MSKELDEKKRRFAERISGKGSKYVKHDNKKVRMPPVISADMRAWEAREKRFNNANWFK